MCWLWVSDRSSFCFDAMVTLQTLFDVPMPNFHNSPTICRSFSERSRNPRPWTPLLKLTSPSQKHHNSASSWTFSSSSSKSWSALRWKPKEEEIQESVRNLKRVEQALKLSPQIADCTQPTNANTNPSKSRNTNTEETVQDSPGHLRGPMGAWGGLVGPLRISTEHLRGSLSPKESLLGS